MGSGSVCGENQVIVDVATWSLWATGLRRTLFFGLSSMQSKLLFGVVGRGQVLSDGVIGEFAVLVERGVRRTMLARAYW
jgi:hypothetical protein